MLFTVTRAGDLAPAVQVNYATQDGSGPDAAHAGTDYTATSGTLLFAANQTTANISVPVLDSAVFQANRTFGVALSDPMATTAFADAQPFGFIPRARSVAAGDFNADGKPDLAVAGQNALSVSGPGVVSVLMNRTPAGAAGPSFAPQQDYTTVHQPIPIAVADINGDGKPDLVLGSGLSNVVAVLLNSTPPGAATPSFAPQQTFASGQGRPVLASGAQIRARGAGFFDFPDPGDTRSRALPTRCAAPEGRLGRTAARLRARVDAGLFSSGQRPGPVL
jgi:hypothetical protein